MSDYKFCPMCKAELKTKYEEDNKRLFCPKCNFVYYNNSRPTASAVITDGDKVLLCRRDIEPCKNFWDLPGGFLEGGEQDIQVQNLYRMIQSEGEIDFGKE